MARVTDRRRHDFFIVDNAVLDKHRLGPHAVMVYCWLARFADAGGSSFPSVPTLAARAGMSQPTVRKAIADLVQAGLVEVLPRPNNSHRYLLLPVGEQVGDSTSLTTPLNVVESPGQRGLGGDSTSLTTPLKDVESNKTHLTRSTEQDKRWEQLKAMLQLQLTADTYVLYVHATTATIDDEQRIVTIHTPNSYVRDWLDIRLRRVITRDLAHYLPEYDLRLA